MKIFLCTIFIFLLSPDFVHAASPSTCPDKILDTSDVVGVYRGVECEDYCHAAIELPNGEVLYLSADDDVTLKLFGSGTGQRVFARYRLQQGWSEEHGECLRVEVLESGKVLTAAGGQ